jgi:8-oxo-dGTP pyrophosphatase MutT (NUDIX family)
MFSSKNTNIDSKKSIEKCIKKFKILFPNFKFKSTVIEAGLSTRQRNENNKRNGVIPIDIDGKFTNHPGSVLTITHNTEFMSKKYGDCPLTYDQRSFPKGRRELIDEVRASIYCAALNLNFKEESMEFIHIIDAFNASRELFEETGILVDIDVMLNSPFIYSDRQKYFLIFLTEELISIPYEFLSSESEEIDSYLWLTYESFRPIKETREDKKTYSNNASTIIRKFINGRSAADFKLKK